MLKQILEQGRAAADAALEQLLPPATQHPTSIHQAMRHSVFAGGKRLRPILCMEAGRMIALATMELDARFGGAARRHRQPGRRARNAPHLFADSRRSARAR